MRPPRTITVILQTGASVPQRTRSHVWSVSNGHDWEVLLVSCGWGSGPLLIVLHAQPGRCSTIIQPQLLIASRLRHPGLDQEASISTLGTLRSAGRCDKAEEASVLFVLRESGGAVGPGQPVVNRCKLPSREGSARTSTWITALH